MIVNAASLINLSGSILGDDKFPFNTSADGDPYFAEDDQYSADEYFM